MNELYDVEENYPERMNNCQFNSSNPESFFERINKTVFLELFQLSTKATVHESKQLRWSSVASNIQLFNSVSVEWNSLKDNSLQSVTEDHKEVILDSNYGPVAEVLNILNYSDAIACFDVTTPSSIQICSDYSCCPDVPSCCDRLNSSDDLSCSGGSSIGWDIINQHNVQNFQLGVRHRNSRLFSIDLCSLVGQRCLQFQSTFSQYNIDDEISYDLYCQWPMVEDDSRWLRPRPGPYPVTFRKEVNSSSFTHLYKFSRAEQMEFARKVGHWLSRSSRKLQRQMKPCFVPLAWLPVESLTRCQSCQPVVCLAPLSKCVIEKWTKRKNVAKTSDKTSSKYRRRSVRHVVAATSGNPIVPLTRCDLTPIKMGKLFEQQRAKRVPLSCLNQSSNTFSMKLSSRTVASRSFGNYKFSQNSSLLYKKFRRKPVILLEKISSALNRIRLPASVSMRACMTSSHSHNPSHWLRMKQSTRNLAARNCMVLLSDLKGKFAKKGNQSSEVVGQKKRMKQMKIDRCFVNLTDCGGKNSSPIASNRYVERKRLRHSNPGWMCVKENHSALAKSLATVKSVTRSNNTGVVLRQNRSNFI